MEVRFLKFRDLPDLYTTVSGIDYTKELKKKITPLLDIASFIRDVIASADKNSAFIASKTYKILKFHQDLNTDELSQKVMGFR